MTGRAAVCLIAAAVLSCDPVFDVCVTVTACESADPIVGAKVLFEDYDAEAFTDPAGVACYGSVGELRATLAIAVEKPGYRSERTAVETPGGEGRFDTAVCLTPE